MPLAVRSDRMRAPTSATIGDRTSATGGTLRMLTAPVKFTFTSLLGAETGAVPVGVRGPSCPHVSVGRCGDQGWLAVARATLGVARIGRVAGDRRREEQARRTDEETRYGDERRERFERQARPALDRDEHPGGDERARGQRDGDRREGERERSFGHELFDTRFGDRE